MKNFEILWELLKCDIEPWSEQMLLGKLCQYTGCKVATNLQNIVSLKCNMLNKTSVCAFSVTLSFPTLWDPIDYSLPGISVHKLH